MSAVGQDGALDSYFSEAKAWDRDRVEQDRRMTRIAWRVAAAAAVSAVALSAALVVLMPLKRVEPFVIRVDNTTGVVDVVPVYTGQASFDESVTRYFLAHYVDVCERFNYSTAERDYEECAAFHSARRNQVWFALWNQSNPASPLNIHKDGSIAEVQVTAVSFFQRASGISDTAQVRYLKLDRSGAGSPARASHWIATIQYSYAAPSSDPKVRRWNPIGFRVLELSAEMEAPAVGESKP